MEGESSSDAGCIWQKLQGKEMTEKNKNTSKYSLHHYISIANYELMNTLQYGLRSVCYFGAKCWNDIPVEIKKSPSANNFRQKVKAYLFERNY